MLLLFGYRADNKNNNNNDNKRKLKLEKVVNNPPTLPSFFGFKL